MEHLHKAYVLHVRSYTDSRLLVDFFTESAGVVRAVGRAPGKRNRAIFQCFQALDITYMGKSELRTLTSCEVSAETPYLLFGESLYCGLYLNELLQRLLPPEDAYPGLFAFYEAIVAELSKDLLRPQLEAVLRRFEFFLLEQLGFGIPFHVCVESGAEVTQDGSYVFEPGSGLRECVPTSTSRSEPIPGAHLLAMSRQDYTDGKVLRSAKLISRRALQSLLGPKPLKAKELFR